jgi:hypothetical protein
MLSLMGPLVLCRRKNFWTEVDFYFAYGNCSRRQKDGAGSGVYACQCLGAVWNPRFSNHQPEPRYANHLLSMTAYELPRWEAVMAVTEPHIWRVFDDAFPIW